MTGRSQRGGANAPEERREAFGVAGKIALDLAPEKDERGFKRFALRYVFFRCDCKRTRQTLSQHKGLQVNNKTLARQRGMMEDLEAKSC